MLTWAELKYLDVERLYIALCRAMPWIFQYEWKDKLIYICMHVLVSV